jgi:pimeloyl-ACP methyl ester carboxylesterase
MATCVLIHGSGADSWYWHRVAPELSGRGHDVVAPDLPTGDESAGLLDYADAVVATTGDRRDVVLVAQSLAGFVAPLVCERVPVRLMVLVTAMVPKPGESPREWFASTGWAEARREQAERDGREVGDEIDVATEFFHDVPADVVAEAFSRPEPVQAGRRLPSHGLSIRGRTCRHGSYFAGTTASSRPTSCGALSTSVWESSRMSLRAGTCLP